MVHICAFQKGTTPVTAFAPLFSDPGGHIKVHALVFFIYIFPFSFLGFSSNYLENLHIQ